MLMEMPLFIQEGYAIYTDEGIKIKDNAPQWAKDEYKEYIQALERGYVEEGEEE